MGCGVLTMFLLVGCARVVSGTATTAPEPEAAAPSATATSSPAPRSGLVADVLPDECLLDALGFTGLLGVPVLPPEQQDVPRDDGSPSSSCFASSARGYPEPLAAINVYEVRTGTPAEFVRSGPPEGRRELTGAGEAAVLVDTAPGVTLQLAGPRHVVTIAVLDGAPTDDAWRAAATAALAALPT